jgi:hypothetical protein
VWAEGDGSLRARWKPAEESKVRMNKLRHRPRYETYFKVRIKQHIIAVSNTFNYKQ